MIKSGSFTKARAKSTKRCSPLDRVWNIRSRKWSIPNNRIQAKANVSCSSYYGVIWTVLNLTVGIAALYSDRVEQALGMRRSNGLILVVIVGGYAALALLPLTYACLAILFLFYIVRGFATPILKGYINQMTFSEMRATVLSIRNFIIRLLFAAIAPFIGWLNDYYSLQVALLISALIIGIPGFLFLVLQHRLNTLK